MSEPSETKSSWLLTLLPLLVLAALVFAGWRTVVSKANGKTDPTNRNASQAETPADAE